MSAAVQGFPQSEIDEFRAIKRLAPTLKVADLRILLALVGCEQPLRLQEIVDATQLAQITVIAQLKQLREAGHVAAEPVPGEPVRFGRTSMLYRLNLAQGGGR